MKSMACLSFVCLLLGSSIIASAAEAETQEARRARFLEQAFESLPADGAGERCLAPYFFVFSDDPATDQLPLKSTGAEVQITGVIAEVKVTQVYRNTGKTTLEALYLFPASTRAAVHRMRMMVGQRVIEARIERRAEAREQYEKALDEGKTASLLEQMRPNVFQMSVGNILPADEVRVELTYLEVLVPTDGEYEFVYPTVVGPRYSHTPEKSARPNERWVENPYLHQGKPPPFEFDLRLQLSAGLPLAGVASPSHSISVDWADEETAWVELRDEQGADRDFVLRYRLGGDRIESGLLLYPGQEESFFLLMLEPPERVEPETVLPREVIFVVDVSGSMYGFPLETAKRLMGDLLRELRAEDAFDILTFAGGNSLYAPAPVSADRTQVRRAQNWLDSHGGGGGTELLPALERALALPRDERRARLVVVITDGYVDVEREAFELVRQRLGEASLFAFGIGSAVNRYLIEGLARAGMGEPFVVANPEEARASADRFRSYVAAPLLRQVKLVFDGFDAYAVEPPVVPDLYASRPVVVFGKYRGEPAGTIRLSGVGAREPLAAEVQVGAECASTNHEALRILWARHRIQRLSDDRRFGNRPEDLDELGDLGLHYGLLTEATSFVAVDTVVRADGRPQTTVRQPLPLPAGVSDLAVGGVGLSGVGMGGGGSGGGLGFGGLGTTGAGYGRGTGVLGVLGGKVGTRGMGHATLVMGSLSHTTIQRVIKAQEKSIRLPYERLLQRNPNCAGKVMVRLTIGADGRVVKAEIVSSQLKDKQFQRELLQALRRLRFPAPRGGGQIVVNYPFVFAEAG